MSRRNQFISVKLEIRVAVPMKFEDVCDDLLV
jgi:hypothetical protein